MRHSVMVLLLAAVFISITGCVAQKEAPSASSLGQVAPSGQDTSSEVEAVIGIPAEAMNTSEPTDEIAAPAFEVSEPVDLGSVI